MHQLDTAGRQAYTMLDTHPALIGVWMRTTMADQVGTRMSSVRRVSVSRMLRQPRRRTGSEAKAEKELGRSAPCR